MDQPIVQHALFRRLFRRCSSVAVHVTVRVIRRRNHECGLIANRECYLPVERNSVHATVYTVQ